MRIARLCLVLAAFSPAWGLNIIVNPSFEYWLLGSPVAWLTSNPAAESSVVRDTDAHSGDYCAKLVGSDTAAFVTSATIVRPGFHYEFTGFTRVPGILPSSFILQFTTLLADPVGLPEIIPVIYSGQSYRKYSRWITAPDSARFLSVTFTTLPHGTAYVDDVTLDDTTLSAVAEPEEPIPAPAAPVTHKLIVPMGASVSLDPGVQAYDLTGRKTTSSCLKPGVYFILK